VDQFALHKSLQEENADILPENTMDTGRLICKHASDWKTAGK
jgi:hypothetical protein